MRAIKVITQLLVTIVGVAMFSSALLLTTAQSASSGTVRALDVAAGRPMVNPGATLDTTQVDDTRAVHDTAWEDAEAEGKDVLVLTYDDAPDELWETLRQDHPEWYDEYIGMTAGHGAFYVPVGTDVPVPGGLYRATLDGWSTCTDGANGIDECNAASPTVHVDIPDVAPVQTVAHVTSAPHTFTKA